MSDYFPRSADYVARYVGLLIRRFRKPRLKGYLSALLQESQALEDAAFEVMQAFNLDDAVGVQLDTIGRILRVPRGPLSDADYRLRLRVEIRVLRSHGTPNDLIAIVLAAFERMVLRYEPWDFATVIIHLERTTTDADRIALMGFLKRGVSSGVRILIEYITSTTRPFTLSDDGEGADDIDPLLGLGDDLNAATGGLFSDVEE